MNSASWYARLTMRLLVKPSSLQLGRNVKKWQPVAEREADAVQARPPLAAPVVLGSSRQMLRHAVHARIMLKMSRPSCQPT